MAKRLNVKCSKCFYESTLVVGDDRVERGAKEVMFVLRRHENEKHAKSHRMHADEVDKIDATEVTIKDATK